MQAGLNAAEEVAGEEGYVGGAVAEVSLRSSKPETEACRTSYL